MGEQPALTELHTFTAQERGLRFMLDAFGNHLQMQRLRHVNNVRGDAAAGSVMAQCIDEGLVDFQAVHRQGLQVGEAAIAGAEVIDQYLMADIAQACRFSRATTTSIKPAFGDLKGNLLGRDPVQRQQLAMTWPIRGTITSHAARLTEMYSCGLARNNCPSCSSRRCRTKSVIWRICPVFSAIGMNRSGLVRVPSGRRQRSKASAPTQLRLSRSKIG
jgi:hypothetical protein